MRHLFVKLFVSAGFHVWCCRAGREGDARVGQEPFVSEKAASDTALVLQQDRDAHVAFVKPSMQRWQKTARMRAPHRTQSDTHSSATLGAHSVIISSSSSKPVFTVSAAPSSGMLPLAATGKAAVQSPLPAPTDVPASTSDSLNLTLDSLPLSGFEEQLGPKPNQPALYAVVAAIAASCGYMSLVAVRCVGLLQELSPKTPVTDYTAAYRKNAQRRVGTEAGTFPRTRRAPRFCPTREPPRLSQVPFAIASDGRDGACTPSMPAEAPPDALSGESSPL